MTPTQRSLAKLRADGWHAEVVERWNPHTRTRHDLFGFGDILAVGSAGVLLVQTTTATNVSSRIHKIADSPLIGVVREAGIAVHVHGWAKKGNRWECRVEDLS